MRCPELQQVMQSFLDGEVDGKTRKAAARHLADCQECSQLIESSQFWNDAVCRYLDHELPADLRASILGDLAMSGPGATAAGRSANNGHGSWTEFRRVAWWAIRRDLDRPWRLVLTAIIVLAFIVGINYVLK